MRGTPWLRSRAMKESFEARAAAFVAGLQALTEQTGVVVRLGESADKYSPEPLILANANEPPGAYAFDGYQLAWITPSKSQST